MAKRKALNGDVKATDKPTLNGDAKVNGKQQEFDSDDEAVSMNL
jgi:hypothetical protein